MRLKPFLWIIGSRYALSRRHSQLVSFISSLSILGLVVGVALLIVVLSVMNGFDRELRERILGIMPHAALYHRGGIEHYQAMSEELAARAGIASATPFVQIQGLLSHSGSVAPVNLYGLPEGSGDLEASLSDALSREDWARLARSQRGLFLGSGLARELSVAPGDKLTLVVPPSDSSGAPQIAALEVLATFTSGTQVDNRLALMNLETASELTDNPGSASGIRLQFRDLFAAPKRVGELASELPYGYYTSDWTRTHGNLYQAIKMSKQLVSLLLFLIIGIAAFNLISTLIMVVVDKQGDIAILRTLGASSTEVVGIFMLQGGLIGALGTSIGLLLGVGLSLVVTDFVLWLEQLLNIQFLHSDVYPISYLPVDLQGADLVKVALTALVLSVLASLYPAWRASRVQPAEALRYE